MANNYFVYKKNLKMQLLWPAENDRTDLWAMDLIARRACLVLENKVSILFKFFCYFQNSCLY